MVMTPADDAMGVAGSGAVSLPITDTVRMPWTSAAEFEERIVRPALAILYRVAVGPGADYYCPRFMRYERTGRSLPSWHWPAFLLPAIWAFYRKLWLPGVLFALLPVAGVYGLDALASTLGESAIVRLAALVGVTWILPGIVGGALANTLLYLRTRQRVRSAEAQTRRNHDAAILLARRKATSPAGALVLGGGALALLIALAAADWTANFQRLQDGFGATGSHAARLSLQREIAPT
jgi:hypothetical protein